MTGLSQKSIIVWLDLCINRHPESASSFTILQVHIRSTLEMTLNLQKLKLLELHMEILIFLNASLLKGAFAYSLLLSIFSLIFIVCFF